MLKKDKTYLLEQNGLTGHPAIYEVKCLEVSETCYKLRFLKNGREIWIDKKKIIKEECFTDEYYLKEELKRNQFALPKGLGSY